VLFFATNSLYSGGKGIKMLVNIIIKLIINLIS